MTSAATGVLCWAARSRPTPAASKRTRAVDNLDPMGGCVTAPRQSVTTLPAGPPMPASASSGPARRLPVDGALRPARGAPRVHTSRSPLRTARPPSPRGGARGRSAISASRRLRRERSRLHSRRHAQDPGRFGGRLVTVATGLAAASAGRPPPTGSSATRDSTRFATRSSPHSWSSCRARGWSTSGQAPDTRRSSCASAVSTSPPLTFRRACWRSAGARAGDRARGPSRPLRAYLQLARRLVHVFAAAPPQGRARGGPRRRRRPARLRRAARRPAVPRCG